MSFQGDSCFHSAYCIVHKGNGIFLLRAVYALRTMHYALPL